MLSSSHSQINEEKSRINLDYCNYIAAKKLIFKALKNQTMCFYSLQQKQLFCIKMFTQNGQMKILKKVNVKQGGITFMNTTDHFINSNLKSLSLWKFDDTQNWHYSKTIITQEVSDVLDFNDLNSYHAFFGDRMDTSQFLGLSKQDDLIVTSDYQRIFFIKKDNNGDWRCTQKIDPDFQLLSNFKFNEKGNILIANVFRKCDLRIFQKNAENELWSITQYISSQQDYQDPYCFIDDYQFLLLKSEQGFITKWEINAKASKIQETKVQKISDKFKYLQFIKSKDLLVGVSKDLLYLIKLTFDGIQIKQIISLSEDFETIFFSNDELMLFWQGGKQIKKQYKISLKRILWN